MLLGVSHNNKQLRIHNEYDIYGLKYFQFREFCSIFFFFFFNPIFYFFGGGRQKLSSPYKILGDVPSPLFPTPLT